MAPFLVNFATTRHDTGFKDMEQLQTLQNDSARAVGIQRIASWNRAKLIKSDFYREHKALLDRVRGAGYWLWKPYIILEQLKRVDEGDVVLYLDADYAFVANPVPLVKMCTQHNGVFLAEVRDSTRLNRMWTKRDCFYFMGLDTTDYHDGYLTPSGLQVYQKSAQTIEFLEELLHYTCDARIVTDNPNVCGKPNFPDFVEHRHDQSVLTLLRLKHKISAFRMPSEFGNHYKMPEFRVPGEYLVHNTYSDLPYTDSPYGTIVTAFPRDRLMRRRCGQGLARRIVERFKRISGF